MGIGGPIIYRIELAVLIGDLDQDYPGMRPVAKDLRSFAKAGALNDVMGCFLVHGPFSEAIFFLYLPRMMLIF